MLKRLKKYGNNAIYSDTGILISAILLCLIVNFSAYLWSGFPGLLHLLPILSDAGVLYGFGVYFLSIPVKNELDLYDQYFIVYNRLKFWRHKIQFNLKRIQEVEIIRKYKTDSLIGVECWQLKIFLKDKRRLSYIIYDNQWEEIQKYFEKKLIKVKVQQKYNLE